MFRLSVNVTFLPLKKAFETVFNTFKIATENINIIPKILSIFHRIKIYLSGVFVSFMEKKMINQRWKMENGEKMDAFISEKQR